MTTYNNVITKFNEFATNHYQLYNFFSGKTWNFQAGPQLFPALLVFPTPTVIEPGVVKLRLNVFVADILNRSSNNLDEIYSDTLSIFQDMLAYFKDNEELNGFVVSNVLNLEPFEEKFDQILAGWSAGFEIELEYDASVCNMPMSNTIVVVPPEPVTGYIKESDYVYETRIAYDGKAPEGSSSSDSVWCITKIETDRGGLVLAITQFTNVKWDDRYSL